MKIKEIYLAGAVSDIPHEEAMGWRIEITKQLDNFDGNFKAYVTNPVIYYNFKNPNAYDSEREIMQFELNRVRKSDLIITNFENPQSLGTMAELAIGYEHRIPIVGLCKDTKELHPWQIEMTDKIFANIDDLIEYVMIYHLS